MNPISKEEITKALLELKYNGKGTKTISTMVLKNNVGKLSDILCHVLNNCITGGYFPNELKIG